MYSSFYPLSLLFEYLSHINTITLWSLLVFSLGLNLYYFKRNKKLSAFLKEKLKEQKKNQKKQSQRQDDHQFKSTDTIIAKSSQETKIRKKFEPFNLQTEMDENLSLNDDEIIIYQAEEPAPDLDLELKLDSELKLETESLNASFVEEKNSMMQSLLQSFSGWHRSLVPFLLQNIGWFIGILCFISGSIFFISYTEGFNKSITIFYTVLSYTLLLAFGGYRLKTKVAHASISGYVLMATSFLLIPLNFSAVAQLIASSTETFQYVISSLSTVIALVTLYYTSRLISGLINRQLLTYFTPVFFTLSIVQLLVPWIETSHSLMLLMSVQCSILMLLLWALIKYIPAMLKQVFIDKKYLLMMSVGSLVYTALVSAIHITISSPVIITLSYYGPLVLLLSGALFYIDDQLNDYKKRLSFLSYFSFVSYAVSFFAIALSLSDDFLRNITLLMAVVLYARLVWLYRSLVPLYLVIALISFLHFDVILFDALLLIPGISSATASQWYYLASLPLIAFFSSILFFLRKSELQRSKLFDVTRHLFHLLFISSIALSSLSQWSIANYYLTPDSGLSLSIILNLMNGLVIISSCFYWLRSKQMNVCELVGNNKIYTAYLYVFLLLPIFQVLLSFQDYMSMDSKLVIITVIIFYYSLTSHFNLTRFYSVEATDRRSKMNRELFVNASLIISLFILLIVAAGFSLSMKMGVLIFIISLNFLLLSLILSNRALFYVFMIVVSSAVVTVKLYLNNPHSTGLLLVSSVFAVFYIIHWLENKKNSEAELLQLEVKKQKNPKLILWFYPANDYSINLNKQNEEMKNV